MNAVQYVDNTDDLTSAKLTSVPIPEPSPGAVVVKVKSAAVNPIDHKVMVGDLKGLWAMPLPFTMGYDFSGVVSAIHPDDTAAGFAVGDAVFGVNWGEGKHDDDTELTGGAFAEYIKIPLRKLSKKPDGVTFDQAAAVALVGTTALQTVDITGVAAGDRVLILGAAGAVGSIAVQLAKIKGAWVATTASKRTADYVAQFGADLVIDYTAEKWETNAEVSGVDVVIDTVGEPDTFARAKTVLKPTGKYISIADGSVGYGPPTEQHAPLAYAGFYILANNPAHQDALAAMLVDGSLKLTVAETFPFTDEGVQGLLATIKKGKAMGKLVLNVELPDGDLDLDLEMEAEVPTPLRPHLRAPPPS